MRKSGVRSLVNLSKLARVIPRRVARFFSNQLCRRGCRELARTHSVKDSLARKRLDYARGIADKQQIVVSGCQSGTGERSDATPRLISGQAKLFLRPILQRANRAGSTNQAKIKFAIIGRRLSRIAAGEPFQHNAISELARKRNVRL